MIYLDHQASTPVSAAALDAMTPFLSGTYGNPHSDDHAAGWSAAAAVEVARGRVAGAVGAEAEEIVFTAGATEANNIAVLGAAAALGDHAGRIVVASVEHKSVLAPARALARRGFELVTVGVDREGLVDLGWLARALDGGAALVSIGAANSEVGTVQPLAAIARMCRRAGALLHSDATQALAWRGIDVAAVDVDLASFSSHKVGGPKGVGALFVSHAARSRVEPVLFGGEQEGGLRPGTLPTQLCVGFGAACASLPDAAAVDGWRSVTGRLLAGLRDLVPGVRLNGPAAGGRHPGNLSLTFPGVEAGALIARLQPGLAVARGSACTSGIPEPSHVLVAIGLNSADTEATLRFSTGVSTTVEEVDGALAMVAAALRAR